MFNWGAFTLFLYIYMRMSGFVLFNPIFGRSGIPRPFQAGFIGLLTVAVFYSIEDGSAPVPDTLLSFALRSVGELSVGLALAFTMRFFLYIADSAGSMVDNQMGLSMGRTYDPVSGSQSTITANMFNSMMLLLFFAENGHITLMRLISTSGELVPFGAAYFGKEAAERLLELFADCAILALKLTLPILAAELLAQVGMGVLNKVIPQINVFVINIDVKMLVGFIMLLLLITPISNFLLDAEFTMLQEIRMLLALLHR